jgi:hypothetical protein
MNTRHGGVNPPQGTHGVPQIDEPIFDFFKPLRQSRALFHGFYTVQEVMKL